MRYIAKSSNAELIWDLDSDIDPQGPIWNRSKDDIVNYYFM